MDDRELDQLLAGMSVYQDVVLEGRVVRRGERDGAARWALIEPHLPAAGAALDVGSSFGWFALQVSAARPQCVVLSAEADERSARVQRAVLASHAAERIVLVTRRIGATAVERMLQQGQRLDAVLCLNVLHWMRDHRAFMRNLGQIAERIFVEYPDPHETDVGHASVRREIGDIEQYLVQTLPGHAIERLGETVGLHGSSLRRSIWLAVASQLPAAPPSPGLRVDALFDLAAAWPGRGWWRERIKHCGETTADGVWLAPDGLRVGATTPNLNQTLARLMRRAERLPVNSLFTPAERWRRAARRAAGAVRTRLAALSSST